MPLTDVIVKSENATYCGVSLSEFCNQTGISWDAGPLNIIGAKGQSATLSTFQAWNSTYFPYSYSYNVIVLAFIKNGQWITSQNGGPVKLIAPHFAGNFQVEQVAKIQSNQWTVSSHGRRSESACNYWEKHHCFSITNAERRIQTWRCTQRDRRLDGYTDLKYSSSSKSFQPSQQSLLHRHRRLRTKLHVSPS